MEREGNKNTLRHSALVNALIPNFMFKAYERNGEKGPKQGHHFETVERIQSLHISRSAFVSCIRLKIAWQTVKAWGRNADTQTNTDEMWTSTRREKKDPEQKMDGYAENTARDLRERSGYLYIIAAHF